jgi:ribosomal protein L37AE/L43A
LKQTENLVRYNPVSTWPPFHDTAFDRAGRYDAARAAPPRPVRVLDALARVPDFVEDDCPGCGAHVMRRLGREVTCDQCETGYLGEIARLRDELEEAEGTERALRDEVGDLEDECDTLRRKVAKLEAVNL